MALSVLGLVYIYHIIVQLNSDEFNSVMFVTKWISDISFVSPTGIKYLDKFNLPGKYNPI
jgi:hypothetical protein